MRFKKLLLMLALGLMGASLSGCTMDEHFLSFSSTTNDKDTGSFSLVGVTYPTGKKVRYRNVEVYPYNNGGDDSTGGKIEIRDKKTKHVIIVPDDAQIELEK